MPVSKQIPRQLSWHSKWLSVEKKEYWNLKWDCFNVFIIIIFVMRAAILQKLGLYRWKSETMFLHIHKNLYLCTSLSQLAQLARGKISCYSITAFSVLLSFWTLLSSCILTCHWEWRNHWDEMSGWMKEMNQEGVEEVLGMSKKVKSKKIKKIKNSICHLKSVLWCSLITTMQNCTFFKISLRRYALSSLSSTHREQKPHLTGPFVGWPQFTCWLVITTHKWFSSVPATYTPSLTHARVLFSMEHRYHIHLLLCSSFFLSLPYITP